MEEKKYHNLFPAILWLKNDHKKMHCHNKSFFLVATFLIWTFLHFEASFWRIWTDLQKKKWRAQIISMLSRQINQLINQEYFGVKSVGIFHSLLLPNNHYNVEMLKWNKHKNYMYSYLCKKENYGRFTFKTYQSLKSREEIISWKILAEWLKI